VDEAVMYRDHFLVGGRWVAPTGPDTQDVVSPATEQVVGRFPVATTDDLDAAVGAARTAQHHGAWASSSPAERADALERLSVLLRKREADIAAVTVEEMGVAVSQAPRSLGLIGPVLEYYARAARSFAFDEVVRSGDRTGLITHEPVGVVAAIIPWNAPVMSAVWKLAPALAAGCTVVLKPPAEAPLGNYLLAEAVVEADLPPGVINVVPGGGAAGAHLVAHPDVDMVAFTGSTAVGKQIMASCAERVARVGLELGGKSAAIVLDDADLATVMPTLVHAGMHLSGQVCGAHTRILVSRRRYQQAVEIAAAAAAHIPVGDPHDPATVVGPLVSAAQRARVEGYLELGRAEGARVVAGGGRPAHLTRGWYIEPTIFADVDNSMRLAREEIFGPVLCLIPFDDEDDAVRIANDSPYGLSGGAWSADPARALAVARRIRTGSIAVNGCYPPFPAVPFGGFKQSGIGRELGLPGLHAFLEPRSIGVPPGLDKENP
jgi:acyl-CoA reductase-like NAD-dependent aldehyde dehydrogenase